MLRLSRIARRWPRPVMSSYSPLGQALRSMGRYVEGLYVEGMTKARIGCCCWPRSGSKESKLS